MNGPSKFSRLLSIFSGVFGVIGLSHVLNDVTDGLIVWYGFLHKIDQVYLITRDFITSILFSWWLPRWPAWATDVVIVYTALASCLVEDDVPILLVIPAEFLYIIIYRPESPKEWLLKPIQIIVAIPVSIIRIVSRVLLSPILIFLGVMVVVPMLLSEKRLVLSLKPSHRALELTGFLFITLVATSVTLLLINYQILQRFFPGSIQ